LKNTDTISTRVNEFIILRSDHLVTSVWWTIGECMSAWWPRKSVIGGLPNISFVKRKPEYLGMHVC